MSIHQEIRFESEICADMAKQGWHYTPPEGSIVSPDAARFDAGYALFPDDVRDWLIASQPDAWERLEKSYGERALTEVLGRLRKVLDTEGTLHVLREGIELLGLKRPLRLAEFAPASGMNPEILARYHANRLRVVRQVHYSTAEPAKSLDLVLFLNGIPVATAELKSDYTQSIEDAVYQYKRDRNPRPVRTAAPEPLSSFPGGALVHFAVSQSEVRMTTRLAGFDTTFLPFNQGNGGGAGNPPNPAGFSTEYLWKSVWARDSWLEILGSYLVPVRDKKQQLRGVIFPRYHQLDATRRIVDAVRRDGPGDKYLIQHSAGSGKTHSIAWTASRLSTLHDAQDGKVFDSVIVVSDRTVLDDQLQDALRSHQRTKGAIAYIQGERKSKSVELSEALAGNKPIIVCTLQTFPFTLQHIRELAATQGKRFAVVADEAHSSQSNETAAHIKVLLAGGALDMDAEEDVSVEDVLTTEMEAKASGKESSITYVAFTATPKAKTLELFGTRPKPDAPAGPDNLPAPFHVYSMRQAIEEGFILDVLKNYTTYEMAFQLAHRGKTAPVVDASTATAGVMGWVQLHSYNIAQHVRIVVEHFRKFVAPLLNGQAKAMVVTSSRLEAVRWHVAMREYIEKQGYPLRTLVAFSGEVEDQELFEKPVSETSTLLNPDLRGRSIRKAFSPDDGKPGEYAILLVANKFQTGFDEPLLCGMYVHKRLDGIQAVQTLSRLNRAYPGKETTYIVDFINDAEDILKAFQPYYETAELASTSDPAQIYDLRAKLDNMGYYTEEQVDAVVTAVVTGAKQSAVDAVLRLLAEELLQRFARAQAVWRAHQPDKLQECAAQEAKAEMDALWLFKKDMGTFVRSYAFLSQIFDYGNTAIEKRAIFFKLLQRLLTFGRDTETVDLSELALTHYTLKELESQHIVLSKGGALKPGKPGEGHVQEKHKESLDVIIQRVNALFEGHISESDKLIYVNNVILGKLVDCQLLVEQAANNTKEQFANSPDLDKQILDAILDAMDSFSAMSTQALESERVRRELKEILLGPAGLYERLREGQLGKGGGKC
ncbi:type I restriction endonuclease subunit R [Acidithiobacillus caldus]|jgi:type I restriction enzyme R subunit|nr:DEAD/DEAH box helicase family protein [Acidithiobacillus caldus]AUW32489.1 type I restriction endonuclease subunit R [Acidithiobacillus caldus]MBU2783570.1 type I restriction endonuclease subunit R [Acidithiobacillus caldus]MBU2790634.1 type I restriction endonuclease subunit R [Acidithiobacillus caldus]MBU2821062.1 type I restriction endonuclease subunit R [Acidithiobacillus caldus]OFC62012.1 type I restriction endonuclease subunit R [Acidithiobacillus caldus]